MKRNLLSLFGLLLLASGLVAQTPLPTAWDFTGADQQTNWPMGWSTDFYGSSSIYAASGGNGAPAKKLGTDRAYVQVHTSDAMGRVNFKISYNTFRGATWTGVLKFQDSDNGTTWRTLQTITNETNVGSYRDYQVIPAASARYFRVYLEDKQTGSNVGLDDMSIAPRQNDPEISINFRGKPVLNGTKLFLPGTLNSASTLNLDVTNDGITRPLQVYATSSITGKDASEFALMSITDSVSIALNATTPIGVTYTPTAPGLDTATLTILNNDASESSFVITLIGGADSLAIEPAAQPAVLSVDGAVTSYDLRIRIGNGSANAGEGILVLKGTSPIADAPMDRMGYMRGDMVGATKVVYSGMAKDTAFDAGYVEANTDYYFKAFAFNGKDAFQNYNTTGLKLLTQKTPDANPGNYYGALDPATTPNFPVDLATMMDAGHTVIDYDDYYKYIVDEFYARDTMDNQKVIYDPYSGQASIFTPPASFAATNNFSREHMMPKSWMPTFGNVLTKEYSDMHNLVPVSQNNVNDERSNLPLDSVAVPTYVYLDAKKGNNAAGNLVFEPKDNFKGDVARAMFYMVARYWNTTGGAAVHRGQNFVLPAIINPGPVGAIRYGQDITILLKWHYEDLPNNHEKARNEYVQSVQGVRNPFVDNPDWVCYYDFRNHLFTNTPGQNTPCLVASVKDKAEEFEVLMFPNPAQNKITLTFDAKSKEALLIKVIDASGRVVRNYNQSVGQGFQQMELPLGDLSNGMYQVNMVNGGQSASRTLMIQK